MCISRSRMEISLPSSSVPAHMPGYPQRLGKMWGHMLASSYCSRKMSTSKPQSVYITLAAGLVDLKIGISNLVGASCFLSLLPLQPLCLCQWPAVSLAVEYLSESGAPLSGEEGGKPPPLTVVHWDFCGLPQCRTAPVRVVSLALVTSSTPEALLTCCGAAPTSWPKESDPLAAVTDILWTGFSGRPLSLWQSEAATDHRHASIRGKRLMVKWAEHEIHSEKASSTWVRTASAASCPKPRWPCLS